MLDRFRVLILARCPVIERATLDRIDAWLASGGVLLMVGNDGIESVEGDSWVPDQATGKVVQAAEFMDDADRDREVAAQIREGLAVHGVTLIDGQLDNVFVSRVEGRLLVLNHSAEELNRELHLPDGSTREITLPANSISTVPL